MLPIENDGIKLMIDLICIYNTIHPSISSVEVNVHIYIYIYNQNYSRLLLEKPGYSGMSSVQ